MKVVLSTISIMQIDEIFDLGKNIKTRGRPRRDTKAEKDKGKEKKKKKKQENAERKRLLKSLNLSVLPSSDVRRKLSCIEGKIQDGLESCIEKILQRNASVDA